MTTDKAPAMTVKEFRALPLDERNAIASELVLNECPHRHADLKYYCIEDGNDVDSGFTCKRCGVDVYGKKCPDYCGDLSSAWRLVEHLTVKPRAAGEQPGPAAISFMLSMAVSHLFLKTATEAAETIVENALLAVGALREDGE